MHYFFLRKVKFAEIKKNCSYNYIQLYIIIYSYILPIFSYFLNLIFYKKNNAKIILLIIFCVLIIILILYTHYYTYYIIFLVPNDNFTKQKRIY